MGESGHQEPQIPARRRRSNQMNYPSLFSALEPDCCFRWVICSMPLTPWSNNWFWINCSRLQGSRASAPIGLKSLITCQRLTA